jgi:hypothetical protein
VDAILTPFEISTRQQLRHILLLGQGTYFRMALDPITLGYGALGVIAAGLVLVSLSIRIPTDDDRPFILVLRAAGTSSLVRAAVKTKPLG